MLPAESCLQDSPVRIKVPELFPAGEDVHSDKLGESSNLTKLKASEIRKGRKLFLLITNLRNGETLE
jgi:hypothetical protein